MIAQCQRVVLLPDAEQDMQAAVDGNGEAVVVGGADKLILILFRRGGIDDQFALVRTIVGIEQLETLDGNAKVEHKGRAVVGRQFQGDRLATFKQALAEAQTTPRLFSLCRRDVAFDPVETERHALLVLLF